MVLKRFLKNGKKLADERRLSLDVKIPNATTRKAIAELEAGKGERFASIDALMVDLSDR